MCVLGRGLQLSFVWTYLGINLKITCSMIQSRLPKMSVFSFQRHIQIMINAATMSLATILCLLHGLELLWFDEDPIILVFFPPLTLLSSHTIITSPWFLSFSFLLSLVFVFVFFFLTLSQSLSHLLQDCYTVHKSHIYTSYHRIPQIIEGFWIPQIL